MAGEKEKKGLQGLLDGTQDLSPIYAKLGTLYERGLIDSDQLNILISRAERDFEAFVTAFPNRPSDFFGQYLAEGGSLERYVKEFQTEVAQDRTAELAKVTTAVKQKFEADWNRSVLLPLQQIAFDTTLPSGVRAYAQLGLNSLAALRPEIYGEFTLQLDGETGGSIDTLKEVESVSAIQYIKDNLPAIMQRAQPGLDWSGFTGQRVESSLSQAALQVFQERSREQETQNAFDTDWNSALNRLDQLIASPNSTDSKRSIYQQMRTGLAAGQDFLRQSYSQQAIANPALDPGTFLNQAGVSYLARNLSGEAMTQVRQGDFWGTLTGIQNFETTADKAAQAAQDEADAAATAKDTRLKQLRGVTQAAGYTAQQVASAQSDLARIQSGELGTGPNDVGDFKDFDDPQGDIPAEVVALYNDNLIKNLSTGFLPGTLKPGEGGVPTLREFYAKGRSIGLARSPTANRPGGTLALDATSPSLIGSNALGFYNEQFNMAELPTAAPAAPPPPPPAPPAAPATPMTPPAPGQPGGARPTATVNFEQAAGQARKKAEDADEEVRQQDPNTGYQA